MPADFVTLDKFHKRRLHPGESLSLFVYHLKKRAIATWYGCHSTTAFASSVFFVRPAGIS